MKDIDFKPLIVAVKLNSIAKKIHRIPNGNTYKSTVYYRNRIRHRDCINIRMLDFTARV